MTANLEEAGRRVAEALVGAARESARRAAEGGAVTVRATYSGTDAEGRHWAVLPGSDEAVPVSEMAVEAAPGDAVSVTIAEGRAAVDANLTNPSAGMAGVARAQESAEGAMAKAATAVEYASAAAGAAAAAQSSADSAGMAASSAQGSANQALADAASTRAAAQAASADAAAAQASAATASASAATASADARQAQQAAMGAVRGLSDVEKVVGTLTWISEHGSYELTSDTAVDEAKVYYTRSGSGTSADPYVYTPVAEPTAEGLPTYYELSIDEAVSNYIASHLAQTDYGLDLLVDGTSFHMHLGTVDGTHVIGTYIIDAIGSVVAKFATDGAQIGKSGDACLLMTSRSLELLDIDGDTFFSAKDLRDSTGAATICETFQGDGETHIFTVSLDVDTEVSATDSSNPANTARLFQNRSYWFTSNPAAGAIVTICYKTVSDQAKSFTLGERATGEVGFYSIAEGYSVVASGFSSRAEGTNTTASGRFSRAGGRNTTASGMTSHAEGSDTTAGGDLSHAEGGYTQAAGTCSHAEGSRTVAAGFYSHAEGQACEASKTAAHAEGRETVASGNMSHAEGYQAVAAGAFSHAQNRGTKAGSDYQTAIGKYNIEDSNGDYALIVGNGTDDSNRSNALTVGWDGTVGCEGLEVAGETSYPFYTKASWSTSSDESTLPVTPCFVLSLSDYALYWCDGS